ncbi:MAG TPA: hypothetical protein VFJ67_04095 [Thermodesulfobacteriota bacterium]|nr:hypothetical protein [Thermodesulfobacteriota bacterium]
MNICTEAYKKYSYLVHAVLLGLAGYIVYFLTQPRQHDYFNYFSHLADAFLHGRLYLTDPPSTFEELIAVGNKYFEIYPPMPAILLMPFVAVLGVSFDHVLVSFFVGGFNLAVVYLIMRKLTEDEEMRIWMTVLFGFGTIHWYLATVGSVWYFAQIVATAFLLCAVLVTFTIRKPLLIGLLVGAAYWSRLPTLLSLPFFVIMLSDIWLLPKNGAGILKRVRLSPLLLLGAGVGIFVLLNFLYNYLRFGSVFDVAYVKQSIYPAKENISPWFNKGLFDLSYIPYHLRVLFLEPPVFMNTWPYVIPSKIGLSILITTPAFIFALFAGIRNKLSLACWSAILTTAFLIFIKSGTGWTQFGYRYALDFYPFLLLLTLRGIGRELKWYHKALIIAGVLVNLWGVLFINKFEWFKAY